MSRTTCEPSCSRSPATDGVVEAFEDDLAPYKVNVPVKLIERFRAKEVSESAKAKPAAPKKR